MVLYDLLKYNPLKHKLNKQKSVVLGETGTPTPFFTATLPLPPSINGSYKIVRVPVRRKNGETPRTVQRLGATAQLEAFKIEATYALNRTACINQDLLQAIKSVPFKAPLVIHMDFYFPTMWKKDVDGGVKAVQDICFKHIDLKDNLVIYQSASKAVDEDNLRVEVELSCFVL